MKDDVQPVINIEASLINVQRGDVMVIRIPENVSWEERHRIATVIRDMLRTQNITIPVFTLPYKWDVMMVEKGEAYKLEEIDQDVCKCGHDRDDDHTGYDDGDGRVDIKCLVCKSWCD